MRLILRNNMAAATHLDWDVSVLSAYTRQEPDETWSEMILAEPRGIEIGVTTLADIRAAYPLDELNAGVDTIRRYAYQMESDPKYMQFMRGEEGATEQAWRDAVEAIRSRYPRFHQEEDKNVEG